MAEPCAYRGNVGHEGKTLVLCMSTRPCERKTQVGKGKDAWTSCDTLKEVSLGFKPPERHGAREEKPGNGNGAKPAKCSYFGKVEVFGINGGVTACTAGAACRNGKPAYATTDSQVIMCKVGGRGGYSKPVPEPIIR